MHIVMRKIAPFTYRTESEQFDPKIKIGGVIHADFKKMRNSAFHRKFFALLNLAFDYWQPGEIDSRYGVPEKNFDQFRHDLLILAGHFHLVIRLDGTVRPEADSISFGKMDQTEFNKAYNDVLSVILKKISVLNTMTEDEVNDIVDNILKFG